MSAFVLRGGASSIYVEHSCNWEGSEADQLLAHFGTNIWIFLHETDSFRLQNEFSIHLIEIESFWSGNVFRNEK